MQRVVKQSGFSPALTYPAVTQPPYPALASDGQSARTDLSEQQMSRSSTLCNINRRPILSLGIACFTLLLSVLSRYFLGESA